MPQLSPDLLDEGAALIQRHLRAISGISDDLRKPQTLDDRSQALKKAKEAAVGLAGATSVLQAQPRDATP